MAFQQGLSGLASSSRAIDVVSNNIANASTVGFKSGSAQFADMYASAMTGAVSTIQVGIGSKVAAVKQAFTQGNLTTTSNPLDMAINGNGFFAIDRNDGTRGYTRNGQFDVDNQGFIITNQRERLMGYQTPGPNGGVPTGGSQLVPIQVPQGGIPPQATQDIAGRLGVMMRANLDSRDQVPAGYVAPAAAGPGFFPGEGVDVNDPTTYNRTTSMDIYDSLGNAHSLSLFFVRTDNTANEWEVWASINGDDPQRLENAAGDTTMAFNEFGQFPAAGLPDAGRFAFNYPAASLPGTVADLDFTIDLTRFTQHGSDFAITERDRTGYAPGEIAGIAIDQDGIIQGRYTNGETRNLAQVALVTFRSPNGLISLGDNLWAESQASGVPVAGAAGVGLNGVLSAGQVEDSNVDLTQELVQLIVQQRNYQANAQSIRTQDQILQTLVNLR